MNPAATTSRVPGFKAHAQSDLANPGLSWDGGAMTRYYPLSMSKIAKIAIEIVSFPMKDGDFPYSYFSLPEGN